MGGRQAWWAAGCGAVAMVLLSGCSDGQLPAVQQVATQFASALGSGDLQAGCGLLSPATRDALEYRDSQACAVSLGKLALPGGDVVDAVDWGGEAQVRTTADTLFLTRTSQGWRISAAGCQPRGDAPYACKVDGP